LPGWLGHFTLAASSRPHKPRPQRSPPRSCATPTSPTWRLSVSPCRFQLWQAPSASPFPSPRPTNLPFPCSSVRGAITERNQRERNRGERRRECDAGGEKPSSSPVVFISAWCSAYGREDAPGSGGHGYWSIRARRVLRAGQFLASIEELPLGRRLLWSARAGA
jgi:hypothetical protein